MYDHQPKTMTHFTTLTDLNSIDIQTIIDLAFEFKKAPSLHKNALAGKTVGMIFEKPSLRTKVSFELASHQLGATPFFLTSKEILSSGNNTQGRESIPDIARNLERFADILVARVYKHESILTLADNVEKPVVNALCDLYHPSQALADFMAMQWHKADQKWSVAFVGDGNNVATSLMHICAIMGKDFSIASPEGYTIPEKERKLAADIASKSGSKITFTSDPIVAVKNADFVYTDTFVSMGQESEQTQRLKAFKNYQVTNELLKHAKPDACFMHCLPAHRGEEVTDEVMDSNQSIIFDQAECKLHTAKALIYFLLKQ